MVRCPGKAGSCSHQVERTRSLVSVPSTIDAAMLRVAPGDPEQSMLWRKLAARTLGQSGVPGTGMPIGDPAVGTNELEAVRQWILAGAPATGTRPRRSTSCSACDLP